MEFLTSVLDVAYVTAEVTLKVASVFIPCAARIRLNRVNRS